MWPNPRPTFGSGQTCPYLRPPASTRRANPSFQPSMTIHIVLPEDAAVTKSTQQSPARHCGDVISGHLEVITRGDFRFEVSLYFEGVVRTWLGSDHGREPYRLPPIAEFQFLKEIQKLLSDPSIRCRSDLFNIYRLPFRFVIPHMLISARSDMDPEFLKLCPSAKVGLTFRGPETAHIYRQPMITYTLRVKQIRTGMRVGTSMKCYKEREIIIMPYTPPAPPLRIEHFPRDYKSCSTKIIKQHRWSRPLGTLEISAAEPSPLNVLTMAPKSSTFVVMMIIFKPRLDICPWNWKFAVKYHLRSRTFCSTRKLDRVPTRSTVRLDQSLTMHDVNSAPEVREYGTLRWRRENHLILERSDLSKNDNLCLWTTTLILPVNASKSLLPTFLNPLSARQYALVLRLSIEGLYHEALELVLPLQVIYYPAEGVLVGLEEEGSTNEEGVFSGVQISDQFTPLSTGPGPSLLRVRNISPPPYDFC